MRNELFVSCYILFSSFVDQFLCKRDTRWSMGREERKHAAHRQRKSEFEAVINGRPHSIDKALFSSLPFNVFAFYARLY